MLSAWVHTTPPGRRARATDSKKGFSKSSWAGPDWANKNDDGDDDNKNSFNNSNLIKIIAQEVSRQKKMKEKGRT